ncbi:MAG: molybdopterin converting factor subunit 1 [Planctomycetes bacterium]|nr:molybdopterin converting factor subunit 1 [Planctomycetota bacterium]
MNLRILYFAHLVERAGAREETRTLPPGCTPAALRRLLAAEKPRLGEALAGCRVAVDEEFAREDTPLRAGQVVAFIPPVSGG